MIFGKKKDTIKPPEKVTNFSISNQTMPVKEKGEGFTAEDIRLIVQEWLNPDHVNFKTRYTRRQVRAMTKLQPIADRYNIQCLKNLLNVFRIAKLSEEGQSSKELVDILRERLSMLQEEKSTVSKLGRFFE